MFTTRLNIVLVAIAISLSVSAAAVAQVSSAGLIAHWTYDDPADIGKDETGNHHGFPEGGAVFSTITPLAGAGALALPVAGSRMRIPHSPALTFGAGAPMSLSLWLRKTQVQSTFHVLGKRAGCGGPIHYQIARDSSLLADMMWMQSVSPTSSEVSFGFDPPQNEWHHIAFTFDGVTGRTYLDGALASSAPFVFQSQNTTDLFVGDSGTCPASQTFIGLLDDVRFYGRTLTSAEVLILATPTGPVTRIVGAGFPFTTIQSAIDASSDGDTVVVMPGTYAAAIDFGGRDITVQSAAGAGTTIIQGVGAPAVEIVSGETSAALEGFTITGGGGGFHVVGAAPPSSGGGIVINGSPVIRRCVITGNSTQGGIPEVGWGAGVMCVAGSPMLIDCVIENNVTGTPTSGDHAGTDGGRGAGVCLVSGSTATLIRCAIRGNVTGGGATPDTDPGGSFNRGGDAGNGAGVWGAATLIDCLVVGNRTGNGGNGSALPAFPSYGPNGAGGSGAGVYGPATLVNCTVADNVCGLGGSNGGLPDGPAGVGGGLHGAVSVTNTIVWGNLPDEIHSATAVTFSDVLGGHAGTGNFDADPNFVDRPSGDYHLLAGSPCRDAGSSAAAVSATDIDGDPRIILTVDVGADEFTQIYPGSGEDLVLETFLSTNVSPSAQVKLIAERGALGIYWSSPANTFLGSVTCLAGQVFATGPAAGSAHGYPEVYLDTSSAAAPFEIYVTPTLPPGGVLLNAAMPAGLDGFSVMLQAFVLTPIAGNGIFAGTDGHELRVVAP